MTSDPAAAMETLRFATAGCDANGLGLRCLAGAARLVGALEEALSASERLVVLAPDSDWAHYELGHTHLMALRPREALESFERALNLNRWNINARRGAASAQANLGNFDAAVEALEQAAALRPKLGQLWLELAQVRELAGDAEGAAAARAEASQLGE